MLLLLSAAPGAWGQDQSVRPGINKAFENPDVADYIKRFENEDREVFVQRAVITAALNLRPGVAIADIGAGTGLFTRLFADQVGPSGKVYAVDIAQPFLDHIAAEAKRRGQSQVQTVRGQPDSVSLPPDSIDLAFLCDTYHHLEYPAKTLASLHRALRPLGMIVVVEFDRREGTSSAFVLEHVRADKKTILAEIEDAGFERVESGMKPELKENFFARFRKKPLPLPSPQSLPAAQGGEAR